MSSLQASKAPEDRPDENTRIPGGTVTFLFTDIEGSTELLKHLRKEYTILLTQHRHILREIVAKWNGHEVDTQGDAFFFSFACATQAVAAAVDAQRSLAAHTWPAGVNVTVRMGLHTGEPWKAEEGYVGIDVHRAARIAHAGHGRQVLISETTAALVMDELPQGVSLLDLGRHLLKDMRRPEHIHQLVIEDLPYKFPPLKSLGILPPESVQATETVFAPHFLQSEDQPFEIRPVFVECTIELEKLELHLQKALSGQGGVVFISGGPGRGKTALMDEFSRRAAERQHSLLVVKGNCNAYSGFGDPYLPFRDILEMLSGGLEAGWSAGVISREQASRLWKIVPGVIETIINHGPDLINRLISGRDLLTRAQDIAGIHPELLGRLQALVRQSVQQPNQPGLDQVALFSQYIGVLHQLAKHNPIVLIVDDLQWIDLGSVNLLFHLGRKLSGSQIMLVGAYRPEELELGRDGERHPLQELLAEFKRQYGDIRIDLDSKDASREQQFVEALLEAEPNQFSDPFRQALYKHTEGHPLFTVELLRSLKEEGSLAQDKDGRWVEKGVVNWEAIPSRVEGVIEERIGRLEPEQRELLTIASVEGEIFTAQVIARIQDVDEHELLRMLGQSLDRKHHLIAECGMERVDRTLLFLFSFRHNLFQKYLYDQVNEFERILLHKSVGEELETLFSGQVEIMSPKLARHFDLAGLAEKAVHYYTQAGKYAVKISANQEAITHFQRALHILKSLPESPGINQQELDLQLCLGPPLTAVKGWAAPELAKVYDRAQELCLRLPDDPRLVRALWLLAVYRLGRSEHEIVLRLIEQLANIAQRTGDSRLTWMDKFVVSPFYQGKLITAREKLESVSRMYEPEQQRALAQIYGMAPSVVGQAYLSNCLWLLGLPDMAKRSIQVALEWAEEIGFPLTTSYVLGRSCWLNSLLNNFEATRAQAEKLLVISQRHRFSSFEHSGIFFLNFAKVQAGNMDGSEIERMFQAIEEYYAMGTILNRTAMLVFFADACRKTENPKRGLAVLNESISLGEKTGELLFQAEACRMKGELLAQIAGQAEYGRGSYSESENCFLRAYEIARSQEAKSLQLRAAISLLKLSQKIGNPNQTRLMLLEVFQDFKEGFNTPDLIEAASLLNELTR